MEIHMISLESKGTERKADADGSECSVGTAMCPVSACWCPTVWFGWGSGLWEGDAGSDVACSMVRSIK